MLLDWIAADLSPFLSTFVGTSARRLAWLVLYCMAALGSAVAAPAPVKGAVDLSQWDFESGGNVSLRGEWLFYSGRWANETAGAKPSVQSIPSRWITTGYDGHGYGTYALKLTLPAAPEGERFAINTGYMYTAYRVYANGAPVATSGAPSATADDEVQRAYSLLVPLPANERNVELRFEVSNHLRSSGGVFIAPTVGLERSIAANRHWLTSLSTLLVGAMLFGAMYHFLVFALSPATRTSLWFALFATMLAVRTLLIEPLAPNAISLLGQDWIWRIDFAASVLLLPLVYQFFALTFPAFVYQRAAPVLGVLCSAGAVASLLFGPDAGSAALRLVQYAGAPVAIVYLAVSIARAVMHGAPGARLALAGWLVSGATVFHDILLDATLINGVSMVTYGFLAFLLCLSGTLAARYSDAFRRTATRNDDLEEAVAERTRALSATVDELKSSQEALERARRDAVSANVAKSRFLATMSHELRTPLNSILGFSDIIRSETLGPVGDQRYIDYAKHINDSGAHLLNLIGDVLDISRIEAGKLELHREPLDVAEICQSALRHAATRERRAADIVLATFEPELPLVNADQRAVMQMVINLLSNALKFTPAGGRIALSVRLRADRGVSIEVADSGAGMDEADIPKALALFSQVDDGTTRKHEGTGLGLPIVKSLIEMHGGTLSLTSEKGKGTTVRLDFPASANVSRDAVAA